MSSIIDWLVEALDGLTAQALYIMAAIVVVTAFIAQTRVTGLRRELALLTDDRADGSTGLLPQGAIPIRLEPELQWARHQGVNMGIACFRIPGARVERAARVLAGAVRGEEAAFRIGQSEVLVGLWNVDEHGMALAIRRLGGVVERAGHPVVEAGTAMFPADGQGIDTLTAIARQQLRPLDAQLEPTDQSRRLLGRIRWSYRAISGWSPGFLAHLIGFALMWPAFRFAMRDEVFEGTAPLIDVVTSIGILLAWSLAAAMLVRWGWNRAPGQMAPSVGRQMSMRMTIGFALLLVALTTWTLLFPTVPSYLTPFLGGTIAFGIMMTVTLLGARAFDRVSLGVIVLLIGVGVGIAILTFEAWNDVANLGRILVAMALGALITRFIERPTWMLAICVGITVVDIWSVFASSGVTNNLLAAKEDTFAQWLRDLLFFSGPDFGTYSTIGIGTTDLLYLSVFLSFAHRWRFDVRQNAAALVIGMAVAFSLVEFTEQGIPVLPFIATAFVLANLGAMRQDMTGAPPAPVERAGRGDPGGPGPGGRPAPGAAPISDLPDVASVG